MQGTQTQNPGTPKAERARLVTIFGRLNHEGLRRVHYIYDAGKPTYVEAESDGEQPVPSIAVHTPAACWYEREIRDQFGIEFTGCPDSRPLLSHHNWPPGFHPLLPQGVDAAPLASAPSGGEYKFLKVDGEGVVEVAVGPVHAGIIEPGHFRFSVMGDSVLHLELRHFYTHKGTEKLFQGRALAAGPMLAESVSGDNCFSHAVAFCQAVESAFDVAVPARAQVLRLIGLEFERLLAHIGDVGALCNDVAFAAPAARAAAIKEALLQASAAWMGTRYWRGISVPGGLTPGAGAPSPFEFLRALDKLVREFAELAQTIMETPSLQNRFDSSGNLKLKVARDLAVVGPVARASGVDLDIRRDHPYGWYANCAVNVPFVHYGDVMARARIRVEEAVESTRLIQQAADSLRDGATFTAFDAQPHAQGYSAVESPRGELLYWVESEGGLVTRCHIKSPSFQNWPALPFAVVGNVIADFPLINKSFNLSYSGCDR
jgi:Ni,Fe-hydrogenase III large subunit